MTGVGTLCCAAASIAASRPFERNGWLGLSAAAVLACGWRAPDRTPPFSRRLRSSRLRPAPAGVDVERRAHPCDTGLREAGGGHVARRLAVAAPRLRTARLGAGNAVE